MTPGPGIEPGTHWWKASALTTAPTLLPPYLEGWRIFKMTAVILGPNIVSKLVCSKQFRIINAVVTLLASMRRSDRLTEICF